jgi:hypothetical protein
MDLIIGWHMKPKNAVWMGVPFLQFRRVTTILAWSFLNAINAVLCVFPTMSLTV